MEISSWGIFFVVFFAILREGFETAIFLISSFSITGTFSYIGFIAGAALAILIGYLIVTQGRKIDLRGVFKYTTLLLVFLSAGMIAYGTHEAEEYLVKSEKIEKSEIYRVWDILEPTQSAETGKIIYHPLHDKGSIGLFLKGFFGYNSKSIEIAVSPYSNAFLAAKTLPYPYIRENPFPQNRWLSYSTKCLNFHDASFLPDEPNPRIKLLNQFPLISVYFSKVPSFEGTVGNQIINFGICVGMLSNDVPSAVVVGVFGVAC